MKRTRVHIPLIAAALLLVGAALAIGTQAPGSQSADDVPPQIALQATAVFLYDADGNVVWSDTFPNKADDAVFRQAASVKLTDAQGQTVFEGPVEWIASGDSSPDAYVTIDGRPVKLEHLIRAVVGHGSEDGSYEDDDHGQSRGDYEHDGSDGDRSHDGSYDSDRDSDHDRSDGNMSDDDHGSDHDSDRGSDDGDHGDDHDD
ncbi:hypothetical protein [Oceanithermus profundus]